MKDLFNFYEGEEERCGFILKSGEILELENIAENKTTGFQIDSKDILKYIEDLETIWHSHPKGSSVLSGQDMQCMLSWPDITHAIIGEDMIRTYRVSDGAVINENQISR